MFVKQKLHLGRPGVQGKGREGRGFGGWVVGPGQESTGTIFVPKHFFPTYFLPRDGACALTGWRNAKKPEG